MLAKVLAFMSAQFYTVYKHWKGQCALIGLIIDLLIFKTMSTMKKYKTEILTG